MIISLVLYSIQFSSHYDGWLVKIPINPSCPRIYYPFPAMLYIQLNTYDSCMIVYYVYIYILSSWSRFNIKMFIFFLRTFEIPYSIYSRMIIYIYINTYNIVQPLGVPLHSVPQTVRAVGFINGHFRYLNWRYLPYNHISYGSYFSLNFPKDPRKIWQGVWESRKVTLGSWNFHWYSSIIIYIW